MGKVKTPPLDLLKTHSVSVAERRGEEAE